MLLGNRRGESAVSFLIYWSLKKKRKKKQPVIPPVAISGAGLNHKTKPHWLSCVSGQMAKYLSFDV